MPAVEWDCEGCGVHVTAFGRDKPPDDRLCANCFFLSEFITDPSEFDQYRQRIKDQDRP